MDEAVEKVPLKLSDVQENHEVEKSTVIVSEDGEPTILHPKVENHRILSAIVKSTDGKFHRLSFDETAKNLELTLLK